MSHPNLEIAFEVFVVVASFYAIYGLLVRRPLIRELRRQIRGCALRMEKLVVTGKIKEDDDGYKILRIRISKAHGYLHLIDMAHLLLAFTERNKSADVQHADDNATIAKSNPELEKIRKDLDSCVLAALGANSPVWAMVAASFVCLLVFVVGMSALTNQIRVKAWDILDEKPSSRVAHA